MQKKTQAIKKKEPKKKKNYSLYSPCICSPPYIPPKDYTGRQIRDWTLKN